MSTKQDNFKDFILDQLQNLHGLRAKKMFGGYGLYQDDKFFGIIDEEELYFKVNEVNRFDFGERDMKPFEYGEGKKLKNYYQVPDDIIENKDDLLDWAWKALAA